MNGHHKKMRMYVAIKAFEDTFEFYTLIKKSSVKNVFIYF
jgi:hypothetical protein